MNTVYAENIVLPMAFDETIDKDTREKLIREQANEMIKVYKACAAYLVLHPGYALVNAVDLYKKIIDERVVAEFVVNSVGE